MNAKPCPFCGEQPVLSDDTLAIMCTNDACDMCGEWVDVDKWNNRPLEDAFRDALKENMRKQPGEYCEWEYANGDEDNASGYDAACGFTWGELDDILSDDMTFCPHCGKRIRRNADDTVGEE
jgi:hypothetical protein